MSEHGLPASTTFLSLQFVNFFFSTSFFLCFSSAFPSIHCIITSIFFPCPILPSSSFPYTHNPSFFLITFHSAGSGYSSSPFLFPSLLVFAFLFPSLPVPYHLLLLFLFPISSFFLLSMSLQFLSLLFLSLSHFFSSVFWSLSHAALTFLFLAYFPFLSLSLLSSLLPISVSVTFHVLPSLCLFVSASWFVLLPFSHGLFFPLSFFY